MPLVKLSFRNVLPKFLPTLVYLLLGLTALDPLSAGRWTSDEEYLTDLRQMIKKSETHELKECNLSDFGSSWDTLPKEEKREAFKAFSQCESLIKLGLCGIKVDQELAEILAELLTQNRLQKLVLANFQPIGNREEVFNIIYKGLKANKSLQVLNICDCKLGDTGAQKVLKALENNVDLEYLDLRWSELGREYNDSQELIWLTELDRLLRHGNLRELDLSHNELKARDAYSLIDLIAGLPNNPLKFVSLAMNSIKKPGLKLPIQINNRTIPIFLQRSFVLPDGCRIILHFRESKL